jgi:hypothetical protein
MDTITLDHLFNLVNLENNLLPYLNYSGWKQVELTNQNWIVMYGKLDYQEKNLQLVFPKEPTAEEGQKYINKAINLLSTIENVPLQLILQNIIYYDRDLFYVRNTETEEGDSIALNLAVDQIENLKKALVFSACSEKEAKPYFPFRTSFAKSSTKTFLFGHTFSGSFGFTIESPKLPEPQKFIQQRLPIENDELPPPSDIPFSRRILERLARGLQFAKQSEELRDHSILLKEFTSGLN